MMADGCFAGAFFVGTPTAAKYVPLAEANKMPIIGLFTKDVMTTVGGKLLMVAVNPVLLGVERIPLLGRALEALACIGVGGRGEVGCLGWAG